ncbi:MAG: N-acetyltransferase [PS1 clade bacterium]|nr:N-acetyltransferase [PS1 clade bacterium]MBL6784197.1 N-acetyltransferase [PS1 clade bacterium]
MSEAAAVQLKVLTSLTGVAAEDWDACANPDSQTYNPFLRHAFLLAMEESGSAISETGWLGQHLVLEDADGTVQAVMPLYLKNHSQGEYIFDYGWADAFHRAGGNYYPKLLSAVPFTPAGGRRLLVRDGPNAAGYETSLLAGSLTLLDKLKSSSLHFNFLPEDSWEALGRQGFLQRTDQQFHWLNDGYQSFDGFLEALASRKRKNLRKERAKALENGIEVEWLTGDTLTEAHWDAFFHFYMDTGQRKWGTPYLTRRFFSMINDAMADDILLIMAKRDGQYIAGALNFIGGDTLFGRNWGCIEDHPFVHFELCYYQAIDFAIARGLKRVEAGAQGTHKLARGYVPHRTYSAHYIAHEGLREAVGNYLESERQYVDNDIAVLSNHTPFRKGEDQADNKGEDHDQT